MRKDLSNVAYRTAFFVHDLYMYISHNTEENNFYYMSETRKQ